MNIWLDLVNSPQVLFFRPIIADLERRGHRLLITSRDFAQTIPLIERFGWQHTPLGRHGGKHWLNIFRRTFGRVAELVGWARRQGPIDLALSHNSYSQSLAAAALRLPFVTLMDYEHQPFNHLCFRLARRVIVPEYFPTSALRRFGAMRKAAKYAGLKEQMYLADFRPTPGYLASLGAPEDKIIVAMRPPAPWAAYHRKFEDTLFDDVFAHVAGHPDTFIIFMPRVAEQGEAVRGRPNVWVPPQALDGPNVLYAADLAISGGGTMNREAAVLGTPAYTVFKGHLGSVDNYLIAQQRMTQISTAADLAHIRIEKRQKRASDILDQTLITAVTDLILNEGEHSYARSIR